jgi:amino acid transporter
MRYQYVVILKRDSGRTIDRFSLLLCLFSGLCFLFEQSRIGNFNYFITWMAILLLAGTLLNLRLARKKKQPRYRILLLIAAVGWLAMPVMPWLGALFFLLAFLEYQARHPLEIGFSPDRIVLNTLVRRKFGWSAFNNVMLKDGLLTLDFKSNRLLQKVVDDDEEGEADEDEFNAYCRDMLKKSFMENGGSRI